MIHVVAILTITAVISAPVIAFIVGVKFAAFCVADMIDKGATLADILKHVRRKP